MQKNSKRKNQLWINIIEAKDLNPSPPNNPYCKIVLGKNIYRTHVIKNTTSPKWDETFFVDNFDQSEKQILYIYVQKKTIGKSHVYGMITVDVSKLQGGEIMKEWCPLQSKNGKNVELGQLNVVIRMEDLERSSSIIENLSESEIPSTNTKESIINGPRSESPVKDLEENMDSNHNEKSKEDSIDQKDLTTEKASEEEDQEISDFAANIISNLQKEITELKLKLGDQEKRKSKRRMTDFFKSSKDKMTSNNPVTIPKNTAVKSQKPTSSPEIFSAEPKAVVPTVSEEEEKAWLSKTEFNVGNFFNSSEEDRTIILQETFDATPLEIFKYIFSDQTNFFTDYHKMRDDYNIKVGKWEDHESFEKKREIEFTAPLNYKIGPSKTHNYETQRYHLTKERMILCIYSRAPEIMFGKYFQVEAFWEYLLIGERKTQLTIKFACPFSDYTVLKGTITKNAIKTYTDSHKMFIEISKNEINQCINLHEKNNGGSSDRILEVSTNNTNNSSGVASSENPKPELVKPTFQYQKPVEVKEAQKSDWLTDSNLKLIYYSNILVWIFIFFILFFKK
eukprot:TRINITY_DN3134_c0_g3_i1.p1 TRINITY_DN3134_c0_g3~~TRINITY_DN3134_c0_g3_i1.p1  ORF type:complete len:564 (-),score=175.96 TRINITY_DN3134_c0_g3_i1:39-1730(-)